MDWLTQLFGGGLPGADAMAMAPLGESLTPGVGAGVLGLGDQAQTGVQPTGAAPNPGAGNALTNALRGLVVPKPPTPQTVHTPAAPRPSTVIHSGELLNLLQMLNVAGQNQGGLKLPSTLGAALGGR